MQCDNAVCSSVRAVFVGALCTLPVGWLEVLLQATETCPTMRKITGSWAEWNVFHLAKNGSQVQMFPDISKRWSIGRDVEARVTLDASTGQVIEIEAARNITRESEHRLLPGGPCDIVTLLIWSNPTIVSGLRLNM